MVCQSSSEVWHDVYSQSREFISSYIKSYPERAMVKLQTGQKIVTELNGVWCHGLVDSIDASLARIYFAAKNRYEWIYRGSTRLRPLFDIVANAKNRNKQGIRRPAHNMALLHKKKDGPYVEYTHGDMDSPVSSPSSSASASPESYLSSEVYTNTYFCLLFVIHLVFIKDENRTEGKQTARKSTSKTRPVSSRRSLRSGNSVKNIEHKGDLITRSNDSHLKVDFDPHQCSKKCVADFDYETGDSKSK